MENNAQLLYNVLLEKPMTRRMAATKIGYPDQTYMVTQLVKEWLDLGIAQVIGRIKCNRSGRYAEAVTTNRKYFTANIQQSLFDL